MSIACDSPWRGCAAAFSQPIPEEKRVQFLTETIYYYNCRLLSPPLADIIYRESIGEADVGRHVFRWDITPYEKVFRDGFGAIGQRGTEDNIFYNLDHYVKHGERTVIGNSQKSANYAFISTTIDSGWYPSIPQNQTVVDAWRYEIFAPGGIWIAQTLRDRHNFSSQDEVCFVSGIAPQYIRSAQRFRLIRPHGSSNTRRERLDKILIRNANFNPQSHPQRLVMIEKPVVCYDSSARLTINYYPSEEADVETQIRPPLATLKTKDEIKEWYTNGASNLKINTFDTGFRSSETNRAYLFIKNEYLLMNYSPANKNDEVIHGPKLIRDGFPSLKGTPFAEYGIDCAFGTHYDDEAFIFCGNLCARINYAPDSYQDKITDGPKMVSNMFPFLRGTVFESGLDAAFESTTRYEAYLFKGNQYALINYKETRCIAIRFISQGFYGLKTTMFESGFDASFASHRWKEAYLFKGDNYVLINFSPASTDDYIIGGPKKILPNFPSLKKVFPRQNKGVDLPA